MITSKELFYTDKCSFCRSPSFIDTAKVSQYEVDCSRCGNFSISSTAAKILKGRELSEIQCANISGFIAENKGCLIMDKDLEMLEKLRTPSPSEKATKIMRKISRTYPSAGESFMINYTSLSPILQAIQIDRNDTYTHSAVFTRFIKQCFDILPWLAAAWANSQAELTFLFQDYLKESARLLGNGKVNGYLIITPKGWDFMDNLTATPSISSNSSTAFVTMRFDESAYLAWFEAVAPAIEDAGHKPFRIDKVEYDSRIDDEIIAAIRSCNFLVADFTGQRSAIYFEAGFAQGLGKQVIWLCREDDVAKVHFDISQHNQIIWQSSELPQLRIALRNRIEATIGRGPFSKSV
jgi:hypothetical protein